MDFFDTEESNNIQEKSNHGIWAEKYRPNDLEHYITESSLKNVMNSFIKKQQIPHLLFFGKPGSGKTTLAKILTSNIKCDTMYVNASDNTGIDFIRDQIRPFAASNGFNDLKIVILDESDFLSISAQSSLRNLMETFSENTRFILTCNYIEKISDPLISRCQGFEIEPPSKKDVAIYLKNILDSENIKYVVNDIKRIVNDYYPDIRKIVNYTQQTSLDGEIKHLNEKSSSFELNSKLIELLQTNDTDSFNSIRQLIADSGIKMFEELYRCLFDNTVKLTEHKPDLQTEYIITLAEYSFQNSMVIDKEITFMACIANILKMIK